MGGEELQTSGQWVVGIAVVVGHFLSFSEVRRSK